MHHHLQKFHTSLCYLASSGSVELLTWGQDYKQKDIYLSSYAPTYSVVVLIVNDLPWTEQQLGYLSGEFTLHSPGSSSGGKWGIMAVIQALYLRSSTSSSSNYDCMDYIQVCCIKITRR